MKVLMILALISLSSCTNIHEVVSALKYSCKKGVNLSVKEEPSLEAKKYKLYEDCNKFINKALKEVQEGK